MIGLDSVSFSYAEKPILRQFSWRLPAAGVVCLWGASGCGKTTLLRLLAGLERPDTGRVLRPERVSVMFQEDRLLPWLTVRENVALPLDGDGDEVTAVLEATGVAGLASQLPGEISGGQCRRVALARALAMDAELLLLDEPFTGVDEEMWRERLAPLIRQRAEKIPVVLVTHQTEEAVALGASFIRLSDAPQTGRW